MPDFDMPGMGRARMGLTELARSPSSRSHGESVQRVKRELVKELYTEIRAARMTGHSWESIRKVIMSNVSVRISVDCLSSFFAEIDKRYEAETGVKALPVKNTKRKRGRHGKISPDAVPEAVKGE